MNIDEYIASGILEQYVSGAASPQEMREVECMSHIYPEINAEVSRLQLAIEQYAKSHSKRPPAHLRNTILEKLKNLEDATPKAIVEPDNNVVVFNKSKTNTAIWKYSAAASIILLVVSSAYFINNQNKKNKEIASINKALETRNHQIENLSSDLAFYVNPDYKKIVLAGVKEKSPESVVTVYWNKNKAEVYLAVNNLPTAIANKQYQLWAIKDGVPVDMGMLPKDVAQNALIKMKLIDNAQAFAITLENEGGVPSPTMSEMYVIGNL
jgi:anti-sigma-K factor RskA